MTTIKVIKGKGSVVQGQQRTSTVTTVLLYTLFVVSAPLFWSQLLTLSEIMGTTGLDQPRCSDSPLAVPISPSSSVRSATGASSYPPPPPQKLWWEHFVEFSLSKGPLKLPIFPFENLPSEKAKALIEILKTFKGVTGARLNLTIIDVGLPVESFVFAQHGYQTESFEARAKGMERVMKGYQMHPPKVQKRIHLHQTALSNVSHTTMEMFDAGVSSSLLESAVQSKQESAKFEANGRRKETVQVEKLDDFIDASKKVVAIKVDTQGTEGEILMGCQQILASQRRQPPLVILVKYSTRLRPYPELRTGIHLLDGLGYLCYVWPTDKVKDTLVLDENLKFAGDFICIHDQATKK